MEYLDPVANLLTSTVLTPPDPATTGTTLVIQVADTASFPDPGTAGEYNLVVHPAGYEPTRTNTEIIRVVSKDSNELTIEREQEGTSARTIVAGDVVAMNITAKMMNDIDAELALKLSDLSAESIGDLDDVDLTGAAEGKILKLNGSGDFVIANDEDTVYTHPNHSGDVTSVADGATTIANNAVTTTKVLDANITYAKIQNVSGQYKVLGRKSANAGVVEEIEIDTDISSVSANDDTVASAKAIKTYADNKLAKTTDVTAINDTGIADGEVAVFNKTNKDIRTSDKTLPTGDIVGTTDTQTLTNKTLTAPALSSPTISGAWDGWISAGETWTYASADDPTFTFTVASDVTTKYSAGMKIKLTQGTVKYFIITAVSAYSGGNTTITVYGGTDYDLATSAITSPYYSMMKSPQGFPMSPAKWSVQTENTSQQYSVVTPSNWQSVSGGVTISIPVGVWDVFYCGSIYAEKSSGQIEVHSTLSTTTNSETNTNFSCFTYGMATIVAGWHSKSAIITLTTKTSYNILVKGSGSSIGILGNLGKTVIRATCAYL